MTIALAKENFAYSKTIGLEPWFEQDYGRWKEVSEEMAVAINGFGEDSNTVLRYAQNGLHFDHRRKTDPKVLRDWMAILAYEFPWFFDKFLEMEDDADSEPETIIKNHINGKPLSNILLWHARCLFSICSHITPRTVLEIGGGYGAFARLWLTSNIAPCDRYYIVDIPESLFFAEAYLRKHFGDSVGYWKDRDPGTKIVLIPLPSLKDIDLSVDLVISMGSMQEMTNNWVKFYMDWLDRIKVTFFYSINYAGQPLYEMGESRNLWSPRPSQQWTTRLLNPDPPLVRVMCIERPFMEALYEKIPATRSIYEWPVLKGASMTRAAYLEGLDLVRQFPSIEAIVLFVKKCRASYRVPAKEILFLAQVVGDELKGLAEEYDAMTRGFR